MKRIEPGKAEMSLNPQSLINNYFVILRGIAFHEARC